MRSLLLSFMLFFAICSSSAYGKLLSLNEIGEAACRVSRAVRAERSEQCYGVIIQQTGSRQYAVDWQATAECRQRRG